MVKCNRCQVMLEEKKINATLEVNSKVIIPLRDVPVLECPRCGHRIAHITHIFEGDKLKLQWGGI